MRASATDELEIAPSYFAPDPIPGDDEIEDYGFAPIGDDDAPDDLFDAPTPPARSVAVAAPTAPVALAAPTAGPVADAEPPAATADTDEWKLFADEPQPGPGLFDDAPAVVAKLEPPPTPTPPEPETGQPQSDPRFPTSRERTQQPPALSLENAGETAIARAIQEIPVPATPMAPAVPAVSSTSDEGDDGEPPVTIAQVRQAWATFMSRAERISQVTYRSLRLAQAEPTQVVGRTVIVTFHNRQWYEMLDENPKVQAFIKKLLAHVMNRETIGVRLELDPTMSAPPRRSRVAEQRDSKKRYDRIAAITANDTMPPAYTEVSPTPAPFGFSGGQSSVAVTAPAPVPSAFGNPTPAPAPRERPAFNRESAPETPYRALPDAPPLTASAADRRAVALAEPLVQEVLSVFGGDIVLD